MVFLKELKESVTSFDAYHQFAKQSFGRTIRYLFVLTMILGLIGTIRLSFELNKGISELTNSFSQKSPDFKLENGRLQFDAKMPYTLFKDKDSIGIIDTTGHTNEQVLNNYATGIFISDKKIVNKKSELETQVIDFSAIKNISVTKASVISWLPYLKWVSLLIIIFGSIYNFLSKMFTALLLALPALIIGHIKKTKLRYIEAFNITVYALTLSVIIQTIKGIILPRFPFFAVIYYGIIAIYLWKAIRPADKQDITQTHTEDNVIPFE